MATKKYRLLDSYRVKDWAVDTLVVPAPLDHANPGATIDIAAALVRKYAAPKSAPSQPPTLAGLADLDIVVYLQGGPGFPLPRPDSQLGFVKELVDRGYAVLLLDQRGTGMSHPLETGLLLGTYLPATASVEQQLEYVSHFRADLIVRDCEVVRTALGVAKWLLLGQLYGGFCSTTYLLLFPASLAAVLITGGIPPIGHLPEDVYRATYARTAERNRWYYARFPEDIGRVHRIAQHLAKHGPVPLPSGGRLSVERFQQLGLAFGGNGGTLLVHQVVTQLALDLERVGKFSRALLLAVELAQLFDTNIVYALFQEAIYMDGPGSASDWAADRLRYTCGVDNFVWDTIAPRFDGSAANAVYFTGEMVFRLMFEDYAELRPLAGLANALHAHTQWLPLYDTQVLLRIANSPATASDGGVVVPVVAATYYHDQYVDLDLTMDARKHIGGIRQFITSELFHSGLRTDPLHVLAQLFLLLETEVD